MPAKKKSSITNMQIGFAIVATAVVLCVKSQMLITQQRTTHQIQRAQFPIATVPVDRSLMSQRLLPSLPNFNSLAANASTFYTITSSETETNAESNQASSQKGPSSYELRLDDQKAWGSQPRRVSLDSMTKRTVRSSEKVGTAGSESPIVPGHIDPHLWYESQHMELASLEVQQIDQLITNSSIEFTELPTLSPEGTFSAAVLPKPLPEKPVTAMAFPVKKVPTKSDPAPVARMTRAWETGRY